LRFPDKRTVVRGTPLYRPAGRRISPDLAFESTAESGCSERKTGRTEYPRKRAAQSPRLLRESRHRRTPE
jgi:hypothetical protein